ncbi:MAG: hypothetical protein HKN12_11895, partial [Gemmatimonadetes bacterium]|nr:hypothetical protein [Gemmatimonadota bacterium]
MTTRWTALAAALVLMGAPAAGADDEIHEKIDILTEEIRKLKERMAIPETAEELESFSGLGPAASKIYARDAGLSIGGYGEFFFAQPTGRDDAVRTADFLRFITYVGYKFSDRILMNTEIEFEHATTSSNYEGRAGSVSVEFSYMDFLLRDEFNVRAGNLLVPMGFVNRMHEPPFFRGNARPEVERRLIPTTWRELGAGVHGRAPGHLEYEAYVVNGFNAANFGANGVRDGRQKGGRVIWEDVGVVGAVDVQATEALRLGGSAYYGEADQNRDFDGRAVDATVRIVEGHAQVRYGGFEGRALVAGTSLGGAAALSRELSDDTTTVTVPKRQTGWYVEGAYDIAPWLAIPATTQLLAWVRYEDWN